MMFARSYLSVFTYFCDHDNEIQKGKALLYEFDDVMEHGFTGVCRTVFQKEWHEHCTMALAPYVVGKETWSLIGDTILQERNWKRKARGALCIAPRQFGKSFSVAWIIVALCCVRSTKQVVLSTADRISKEMREKVVDLLGHTTLAYQDKTTRKGFDPSENLFIRNKKGDLSRISFFPSQSKIIQY